MTDRREDGKWSIVCLIDKGFFDPKQLTLCANYECLEINVKEGDCRLLFFSLVFVV